MSTYYQLLPVEIVDKLKPYLIEECREEYRKIIEATLRNDPCYPVYIFRIYYVVMSLVAIYSTARTIENICYLFSTCTLLILVLIITSEVSILKFKKENEYRTKRRIKKLVKYLSKIG